MKHAKDLVDSHILHLKASWQNYCPPGALRRSVTGDSEQAKPGRQPNHQTFTLWGAILVLELGKRNKIICL